MLTDTHFVLWEKNRATSRFLFHSKENIIMNRITTVLLLGLGVLLIAGTTTAFVVDQAPKKKVAHYTIQGAFCGGCVVALTTTAEKIEGVEDVKVIVDDLLVLVTFDEEKTTAETIRASINEETTFNLALKEVKDKEETDTTGTGRP